jgi:oligopeptide/dipeptide ABC transporter ATP-binding protein
MRDIRGNKIAIVFQEPMTSLNPVYTVGNQIAEAIKLHQRKNARQAWANAIDTLRKVSIAEAKQIAKMYPHQLSGGMQQRVMMAMAVSCKPALLIADEPTTALDVTIQAQILDLLEQLQRQNRMSILLITHDLGVVAERADNIAVMYASRIVEIADSRQLFAEPFHPYTQGLLQSLPRLGVSAPARDVQAHKRLPTIPGTVPEPLHFPAGCKFHPRCPIGCADKRCQSIEPELREVQPGRYVACWYAPGYEKR